MPAPSRFSFVPGWPEMSGLLPGEFQDPTVIEMMHRRDRALEDYLDTLAGGKEYATVVVAAADTHASGRATADFAGDGVADENTLQQAFDSCPEGPPGFQFGVIQLLEGTYTGSGTVNVPPGNFVVLGGAVTLSGISFYAPSAFIRFDSVSIVGDVNALVLVALNSVLDGYVLVTNTLFGRSTSFRLSSPSFPVPMIQSQIGTLLLDEVVIGGIDTQTSLWTNNLADCFLRDVRVESTLTLDSGSPAVLLHAAGSATRLLVEGLSLNPVTAGGSATGQESVVSVDGFKQGYLDLDFEPHSTVVPLWLRSTENLVVKGRCGIVDDALPQVRVDGLGATTSQNNAIEFFHFEGNSERGGFTGQTTHHIDIDTGVVGTVLAYNYYGGADLGDVLDNGTGTVYLPDAAASAPLTGSTEAALFWMDSARSQPSSGTSADETLVWMQGGESRPYVPDGTATYVPANETLHVPTFKQVLWALPIVVDGFLEVDGDLVEVD